jgi:hypothetical protein
LGERLFIQLLDNGERASRRVNMAGKMKDWMNEKLEHQLTKDYIVLIALAGG